MNIINTYKYYINDIQYTVNTELTRSDASNALEASAADASAVPTPQTIDDDYCPGCDAGADCIGAHSDACNRQRGVY